MKQPTCQLHHCQMINRKQKEKDGQQVIPCRIMYPGGAKWCSFPVSEESKIPALGASDFTTNAYLNPGMNEGTFEVGDVIGFAGGNQQKQSEG